MERKVSATTTHHNWVADPGLHSDAKFMQWVKSSYMVTDRAEEVNEAAEDGGWRAGPRNPRKARGMGEGLTGPKDMLQPEEEVYVVSVQRVASALESLRPRARFFFDDT